MVNNIQWELPTMRKDRQRELVDNGELQTIVTDNCKLYTMGMINKRMGNDRLENDRQSSI